MEEMIVMGEGMYSLLVVLRSSSQTANPLKLTLISGCKCRHLHLEPKWIWLAYRDHHSERWGAMRREEL